MRSSAASTRPSDGPRVRELGGGDLDALPDLYGHRYEEPPEHTLAVEAGWQDLLADERTAILGVEHEGRLVASFQLTIVPAVPHEWRPFAVLEHAVTHADHRGQRFGTRCVERAIECAHERGCYTVFVQTGREDPRVHEFYEQCGFDGDAKTGYSLSLE
ncbi:MAG: GNAT family N-acetyltransferase [Halorhabdus sp.]